ncbi:unnamed protein product [Dibothriocephalus latus]|uniref:Uncharacterized protein n=1 Tax=Dibothriocephalus latus TaxID=60516 RepID=A0A3P6S444_DIBLA|nr:unnamed protein product [Dibothriocephalus latus]
MPARDGSKSCSPNNLPEIRLNNNNSTGKAATLKYGQQQQHSREDRLRGIEEQIGRLSGCFHLCADQITGSTLGLSSKNYLVQIELQPQSSLHGSRMSLFNLGPRDSPLKPLGGSSLSLTNDTSTPFCWCFQLSANQTGFYASSAEVNASVTGYVPRYSTYALSETKANLSPEPFTTLVVKVSAGVCIYT